MGTEDEYVKANEFINENKLRSVGTLSKSEWEVASMIFWRLKKKLYCTLIFIYFYFSFVHGIHVSKSDLIN